MNDMERIHHQWHEYAKGRDTAALIGLYAEDAVFESPLVPVIMGTDSGVLRGRPQILAFLEEGTRRRPNELVRWYRTGQYLVAGDTLVWEYPRSTHPTPVPRSPAPDRCPRHRRLPRAVPSG